MEQPPQITARHCELSPGEVAVIEREIAKLQRFYAQVTRCRVLVEAEHRFPSGEVVAYAVRVDLIAPEGEVTVGRQRDPTLLTAIQRAFEAAGRQLEDYARIHRGDVGTPESLSHARVHRLFPWEGYGFLETPDGREIYFHRNSVLDPGFDHLEAGSEVRFVEAPGEKGPQATTVTLLGRGHRHPGPEPQP